MPSQLPCVGDAVGLEERVGVVAERVADLGRGPGERLALDALGVRVLAGGECPVVAPQLADHVVERPGGDLA